MLKFIKNYSLIKDDRGEFRGLINQQKWEEINYFKTKKNQVRANHYHKQTDELFIILEGKIEVKITNVDSNGKLTSLSSKYIIRKNDVFIIEKMSHHIFKIVEDSIWINALTKKYDLSKPDIISI